MHPLPRIHRLSDGLPDFAQVRRLGLTFNFILLSALIGMGLFFLRHCGVRTDIAGRP
jgi:hypothetical protein